MYSLAKFRNLSITGNLSLTITDARLFATTSCKRRRKDNSPTPSKNPIKSTVGLRRKITETLGSTGSSKDPMSVFKPVLIKPNTDDLNYGEEIAGKINRQALLKELNLFYFHPEIKTLSKEQGLDDYLLSQAYTSFRRFCMDVKHLPGWEAGERVKALTIVAQTRSLQRMRPLFESESSHVLKQLYRLWTGAYGRATCDWPHYRPCKGCDLELQGRGGRR